MAATGDYVVVTTEFRGVFGGILKSRDGTEVTLEQARVCVYWSSDVRGFIGLAATGPTSSCKISPAGPEITLTKVTSITVATPVAREKWEAGPWNS